MAKVLAERLQQEIRVRIDEGKLHTFTLKTFIDQLGWEIWILERAKEIMKRDDKALEDLLNEKAQEEETPQEAGQAATSPSA